MIRLVSLAAAALGSAMLFSPVAAYAQQPASYYVAAPATAPDAGNFVTRDTIWSCNGQACVAKKAADRDEIMCERIVKQVGKLDSFTAGGAPLGADALDKCNARAK